MDNSLNNNLNNSLAINALRFYAKHTGIITDRHLIDITTVHYYPLIKREQYILIHVSSVVTFCHKFGEDQFVYLTHRALRGAFPEYCTLSIGGSSFSFRMIEQEQFNNIIK